MRCLILGGDGMLGHQLLQSWRDRHDARVTLRGELSQYEDYGLFTRKNSFAGVNVLDADCVADVVSDFRPDAVVNAVGVIKQRSEAKMALPSLEINAVFPHRLRLICRASKARLVHVSTDCVFNGIRGNYTESDPADAHDLYGLSKHLGEVSEAPAVTLRTSIIGLELSRKRSLIEWFLAQQGEIKGFTRAIYTGLTTLEFGRVIERVLTERPDLSGVWQVASAPINKYDLLTILAEKLDRHDVVIKPDGDFHCDRSLLGDAFNAETGYVPPTWDAMLEELAGQIRDRNAATPQRQQYAA